MVPSITYAISFSLSTTMMSGLFAPSSGHVLSKCWTSQKIFALEFSTVANGGGWRYYGSKFCWFNRSYFSRNGNIWVSASYHALPYINSVQSECMMSGYVLLTLYLNGIFCIYHRFVDRSCIFGKACIYQLLTNVVIYRKHNVWDVLPFFVD